MSAPSSRHRGVAAPVNSPAEYLAQVEALAAQVEAETSRAMREVARLHLPPVRWRPVCLPGTSTVGWLGELVAPEELARLEELLR